MPQHVFSKFDVWDYILHMFLTYCVILRYVCDILDVWSVDLDLNL